MATMSAVSWPSEGSAAAVLPASERPDPVEAGGAPRRQRSEGLARISARAYSGISRVADLAEAGALRLRVPRGGPALEAVIVNTAGGVACGDVLAISGRAESGAHLVLSTPAAEKIYRSDGPVARIDVTLAAEAGARLDWLPQETILFDQARLHRRFEVDLAGTSRFLAFEALMLGRPAHGDLMSEGVLRDRWRVRRDGRLIFADALRLEGPVAELLARPTIAAGGRAMAQFLYVAPDAEARLEAARALLEGAESECGASAWNGLLAVRFLARRMETLRRDAASFLMGFREAPLPRVWAG